MAKKISDLPDGSPLTGAELIEFARDGSSFSAPVSALASAPVQISIDVDYAATAEVVVPNPSAVNDISAITKGTVTTVTTATPHGYTVKRIAVFVNVEGMTEINGLRGKVTSVPDTTHFVCDIDSSTFSTYTSGGQTYRQPVFDGADAFDGCVVLLPAQLHDYKENGVYVWTETDNTLTRHPDMATGATIASPYYVGVRDEDIESEESGDDNAGVVFGLDQSSVVIGTDQNTWSITTGGGLAGPNYILAGPAIASARPNISRMRPMSTMDLPQVGVSGGTNGYFKVSAPQLMQKAPRISSYIRSRETWHDLDAFNFAQTIHKEFVVDQMLQFRSAPTFQNGRRIIFEGTGFDGAVRILTYSRNLKPFNVSGTTDLTLDGHLVFEELIPHTANPTSAIYANASFKNLRLGQVWSRGFSHAVYFATSHEGFQIDEVNVYDTATETGFASTTSTGSQYSVLQRNLAVPQFQTISADAAQTLKVHSNSPVVELSGTYTANRSHTLSTENVTRDATMRIRLTGTHSFYAGIGGLANIYSGQECIIGWDGVAGAWKLLEVSGATGTVVGPSSATNNAAAVFNGTSGTVLKDSKVTLTAPATGSTLTIADGKTLTASNSLTLAGTDSTTMTFPSTSTTVAGLGIAQTFSAAQTVTLTDNTNPGLTIVNSGSGGGVYLQNRFFVNTSGDLIQGVNANAIGAIAVPGSTTPRTQLVGTTITNSTSALINWSSTTTNNAALQFAKSRGTSPTHTVVTSGGTLGVIGWSGSDGTAFIPAASIEAFVAATPGTNDMPGRLVFSTTADGAAAVTERLRIDNNGMVAVTGGSLGLAAPVTKTADFTVATTENYLINNKSGSTCTVTLPSASTFSGRRIVIKTIQAQTVVSASSNVVPQAGGAAGTAILAATAGKWAELVANGTNWEIMASG